MKKLAIIYDEYSPTIDAIKCRLQDVTIECLNKKPDDEKLRQYDLVVLVNCLKFDSEINALAVHHSLLPSFNSEYPVQDAILSGVKVTGITIYYTKTNKIIAQYPLFIYNDSHADEIAEELRCLEQTLYPLVIEKILRNEQFEIQNLIGHKACGGCSGCSH